MRRYKYLLFSIISFMLFNINIVLADTMDACTNVGILKVIYFIKLLLNIAFIAVPIGLIVFGLIDFSKSVASGDEKDGKKNLNLFIKRLIYGALVFCVPWIVNVVMHLLGDLTKDVNWTDSTTMLIKNILMHMKNREYSSFFLKIIDLEMVK